MVAPSWQVVVYFLAVVGPWLLMVFGLASARVRLNKLRQLNPPLPAADKGPLPEVTVLIPAKNEGDGMAECLRSVLAMDYPNFRVVAIDDRSSDNTLAEMRKVEAEAGGKLSVLEIKTLPEKWLGKCHALYVAGKQVTTPWILFIDSDVMVTRDALSKVMAMALARRTDALSLLTHQKCETFLERLSTPLACGAVVAMYTGALTNDDNKKNTAFANGQFFLIRREAYEKVGGHEAVRFLATEDVDLMRLMKRNGFKTRLYAGEFLAATRMYDSVQRMYKGWARIYSTASHRRPWRILGASLFTLSGMWAWGMPLLLACYWRGFDFGGPGGWWWAAAVIHLLAVIWDIGTVYKWAGTTAWQAVMFPVAGAMQLSYFAYALLWCFQKKVEWRGTVYTDTGQSVERQGTGAAIR